MSHPSRPQARGPAQRRRRNLTIEGIESLEGRQLLATSSLATSLVPVGPVLTSPTNAFTPTSVTFTAAATPTNADLGTVSFVPPATTTTASAIPTAAPFTSVSELAPVSEFGGDIVRIKAGPGGVFGDGVYAISRGAGSNTGAINRPGVIYRVDPATGNASVFFDLNTVISQLEPGATAANSLGAATGLVNWYDIAFDPEGTFDGRPSMFVSSTDRSDPNKNIIYRIAPDGSFMGAFVQDNSGIENQKFTINPTAILVPPPQQQAFLHGLIAGSGGNASLTTGEGVPPTTIPTATTTTTNGTVALPTAGTFSALYFDKNAYSPGQQITTTTVPTGVSSTALAFGPQVGLTAANNDYSANIYDAFTDFGTPTAGGIAGQPGASGVQGLDGDLIIGITIPTTTTTATGTNASPVIKTIQPADSAPALATQFRRFEDVAFDQYGYFSQAVTLSATTTTNTTGAATASTSPAAYAGSLFVTDLAPGPIVTVTPKQDPTTTIAPTAITVPVQGPGMISAHFDATTNQYVIDTTGGNTTGGGNFGGRIIRITPTGQVTTFAQGFNTSGNQDATSFVDSSLSISFSADGTTLYASDNDAIWQFKTTASLASSTSGSILGLNDLRSLGVPYDGQNTAVAIIDTGVDGTVPNFRGRVATGINVLSNGAGNQDTANATSTTTTATTTGSSGFQQTSLLGEGHGTEVAGIVSQFVPQATIEPVNVFYPFTTLANGTTGTTGTTTTATTGTAVAPTTNGTATVSTVYNGLAYVAKHPFVNDPIRPGQTDRVVASVIGFGTTATFEGEGSAYQQYPQIVIAFKNQLKKFRSLGIAPIAAAGQFGSPLNSTVQSGTTGAAANTNTGTGTVGATNNSENKSVGDVNGISLPAVLNEVISVTGTYPFPFVTGPNQAPTDPSSGFSGDLGTSVPILIAGPGIQVGAVSGTTTTTTTTAVGGSPITQLTTADSKYFSDQLLGSDNRNITTDFAAPEIDLPTFRRRGLVVTTATGTTTGSSGLSTDPLDHNTFIEGGTSLSAAVIAGEYSMVSSALNYWSQLNLTGVTSDAYLTQPVGALTLNYGKHGLKNLSVYNNPDGINAILAWTAVPVTDANLGLSQSGPMYQFGSSNFRQYARPSISNAIYAIEGTEAIQYLLAHNIFPIIDANQDGKITSQELQTFTDNASKMGMPEAGAMARLLGGTSRIGTNVQEGLPITGSNGGANAITTTQDSPEQPDVLQRRFNFFDYATDGQLNGFLTIPQYKELAHTLLPNPTAYTVTDRQRASANGFLLDPGAVRNFHELQHVQPNYQFVPKSALVKYRNVSPDQFKVNRLGLFNTPTSAGPYFSLFAGENPNLITTTTTTTAAAATTQTGSGTQAASTDTSGATSTSVAATTPTPSTSAAATTTTSTTQPTTTGGTTGAASTTVQTTQASTPATTGAAATGAAATTTASTTQPTPAAQASANLAQAAAILQNVPSTSGSGTTTAQTGVGSAMTQGTLTPITTTSPTPTPTPTPAPTTAAATPTPTPTAATVTTPTPTPTATATPTTPTPTPTTAATTPTAIASAPAATTLTATATPTPTPTTPTPAPTTAATTPTPTTTTPTPTPTTTSAIKPPLLNLSQPQTTSTTNVVSAPSGGSIKVPHSTESTFNKDARKFANSVKSAFKNIFG